MYRGVYYFFSIVRPRSVSEGHQRGERVCSKIGTSVVTSLASNKRAYWPTSRREATVHTVNTCNVLMDKNKTRSTTNLLQVQKHSDKCPEKCISMNEMSFICSNAGIWSVRGCNVMLPSSVFCHECKCLIKCIVLVNYKWNWRSLTCHHILVTKLFLLRKPFHNTIIFCNLS